MNLDELAKAPTQPETPYQTGEQTKRGAKVALDAVDELYRTLPKSKRGAYLGHLNEITVFIERATAGFEK